MSAPIRQKRLLKVGRRLATVFGLWLLFYAAVAAAVLHFFVPTLGNEELYLLVPLLLLGPTGLIVSVYIFLSHQYFQPLRKLTFAVRDNRLETMTRIARNTRAVELHRMIASFLGLMSDRDERRDELEAAVEARTAELRGAQEQMMRQEKLASLGRLSAGIAHEINNPAGYVMGNLEVLGEYVSAFDERVSLTDQVVQLANSGGDRQTIAAAVAELEAYDRRTGFSYVREDIGELISALTDGMKRITKIVQGLNAFSRHEGEAPEVVDLKRIVDTALEMVWNELKYDYTVDVTADHRVATSAVGGQLVQVLVNLLVNARDATPSGGTIAVSLEEGESEAIITVTDTGTGIPPEKLDTIFDPFFTTKPVGSGTGLGLAICNEIVTNFGGTISVESEVDKGTSFEVRLPAVPFSVEEIEVEHE